MSNELTMRNHVSVLFGKGILWVELVLLALMIYFHIVPLVIFMIFLTAMNVIVMTWKNRSLVMLTPTIEVSRSRVFAEETVLLKASIKNEKLIPLPWLEFEIRGGGFDYQTRLLWIMWKQTAAWNIHVIPQRRGLYNVGQIVLRSGDGFRFTEEEKQFNLKQMIYVWPKLVPVQAPLLSTAVRWALQGNKKGILDDPLFVNGIRDYQNGDEWRRINWQASARLGKLQSNVYQPVLLQSIHFFVDVRGFDDVEQQAEFERFLSVVASLAVAYADQGITIVFSSNGTTDVASEIGAILDEFAKISTESVGSLPLQSSFTAPLFYFCKQITMNHIQWFQLIDRSASIMFYHWNESSEKLLLSGSCPVKPIGELFAGKE